ncbi:MAG TPA: DNA mismatch repair protein MutS, partial [Arenibacter sp.]|nr:DNA mismatch repair protein MutS [Arenibacter sp.]
MNNPLEFYSKQKEIHQQELSKISKKLLVSSLIRLFIFLAICFTIYYFFGNMNVIVPVIIGG